MHLGLVQFASINSKIQQQLLIDNIRFVSMFLMLANLIYLGMFVAYKKRI